MANNTPVLWQHHQPVHLVCAPGSLAQLAQLVRSESVLLLTSQGFTQRGITAKVRAHCAASNLVVLDQITPNPELDEIEEMAQNLMQGASIQQIVAIGGGSVMDTAKVLAAMLPIISQVTRPLHRHFREQKPVCWGASLPLITVPTTAGTGAEVTPFATIWDRTTHSKYSLSGDFMFPNLALLDVELTLTLPDDETLNGALDALSHALESLWNRNRTPISCLYAQSAIDKICFALPLLLQRPTAQHARAELQQASLLAGLAISQTRTAIAHSISYPLTSHYGVPHGIACSFTLPALIELCVTQRLLPDNELCLLITAQHLLEQVPLFRSLRKYLSWEQLEALRPEMFNPQRADNFIQSLTESDISAIIERSKQLASEHQ